MQALTSGKPPSSPSASESSKSNTRWQRRLLPLIVRMLLGLTLFFFVVSLGQLAYLHWRIEHTPRIDLQQPLSLLARVSSTSSSDTLRASTLMVSALLEANALERRYHQAGVVLMARVWTSYLGFVTGMILALLGSVYILGRVEGSYARLEAKVAGASGALRTSAPGIVLASLGVLLMIATLFVHYDITVSDAAVYSQVPDRALQQPPPGPPPIAFPTPRTDANADPNGKQPK